MQGQLDRHRQERRNQIQQWEDYKRKEFKRISRAAKKVSKALPDNLRVQVEFAGNREEMETLLRDEVGGHLKETINRLSEVENISVSALANACRKGAATLQEDFGITKTQAEKITAAGESVFMRLEELELQPTTDVELNIARQGEPHVWKRLDSLSIGQKATALLFLLMLESDSPLIIDQPENDLDNRFIADGIVPQIRNEKMRRQFLLATHNPNIPVLGDAELIIGLTTVGGAIDQHVEINPDHLGSIDKPSVTDLVKDVLEGGEDAFNIRKAKYGV